MPASTPTPWTELLSQRFGDITDEYGPHSQTVASAFATFSETRWLSRRGEFIGHVGVTRVETWSDALTIFREDGRYNVNGVLRAAYSQIDSALARTPQLRVWWSRARSDASEYALIDGIPQSSLPDEQALVFEYLYEFVSMLLAEIILSDELSSTYFRDQLAWFHAGRFPCGWDGDWPLGRMRVY